MRHIPEVPQNPNPENLGTQEVHRRLKQPDCAVVDANALDDYEVRAEADLVASSLWDAIFQKQVRVLSAIRTHQNRKVHFYGCLLPVP